MTQPITRLKRAVTALVKAEVDLSAAEACNMTTKTQEALKQKRLVTRKRYEEALRAISEELRAVPPGVY